MSINNFFSILERILSFLAILLCSPFFILISLIIKFSSSGPIFFTQRRAGINFKPFFIYKFRTMIKEAEKMKKELLLKNEADGPVFKIKNDPRYTKFGKWLAERGLDELPQLFNILKGEMSFIGPRPLPICEALKIPKKYHQRFSVKPGLLSTWAISGAFHNNFDKWMKMDLKDIKNKNFFYNLSIIIKGIKLLIVYFFTPKNGKK